MNENDNTKPNENEPSTDPLTLQSYVELYSGLEVSETDSLESPKREIVENSEIIECGKITIVEWKCPDGSALKLPRLDFPAMGYTTYAQDELKEYD